MSEPFQTIEDGLREEFVREVGRSRYRLWFRDTVVRSNTTNPPTWIPPPPFSETVLSVNVSILEPCIIPRSAFPDTLLSVNSASPWL